MSTTLHPIYFIGAGPGDPDLITVKGLRLIQQADIIIYAGSLVPEAVINDHKAGAVIHNSATMHLDEIIAVMKEGFDKQLLVARVHTGDPSIYGSTREQMEELDKLHIPYATVPGVSSFLAAAASLNREFTVPGLSQTVICTRMEGRTPVPELEQIERLAAHQTSMAIFLSVGFMPELCQRLMQHYPASTPMAVVQRASWPDQKRVLGTIADMPEKVAEAHITKTAMILVGPFLGDDWENSLLYAKSFTHEYRKGQQS